MAPKLIIVLAGFCYLSFVAFGQTRKVIDSVDVKYKVCLDNGRQTFACAKKYYCQMDSLVNAFYHTIYNSLDTTKKSEFKKNEIEWLNKRDKYFKKTYLSFKKDNPYQEPFTKPKGAEYDAMIMFDKNAKYVRDRVIALAKMLDKINKLKT
ncbi:lysozyme inhibitor LprI family protein [Pinibacter soli]|uniref:DUF1311 domain-containing protein n=1 Tax=Pinibacter soli TaxID=3044211 RepID=A0ABT6RHP3_9BACT|nr:lysozyme inhibitor LprI family protein [Pinibacter soli]MDI3322075.1 hypothetical protein [Pinibacter soli]